MSQDKTEKKTPVGKYLSIKDMPEDHPLYKRGFVIGGKNLSHFSEKTQKKGLKKEAQKPNEGKECKLIRFDFPPGPLQRK